MVLKDGIPVIIVDAPAFAHAASRRSISMPMETVYAVFDAARHFGARYLVLQYDKPVTMVDLYVGRATVEGLTPVVQVQDALGRSVTLYEITR